MFLESLREMLGRMKRRRPTHKLCPVCQSSKLHLSSRFDAWLLPERYVCEECGYTGAIVLEVEPEEETCRK